MSKPNNKYIFTLRSINIDQINAKYGIELRDNFTASEDNPDITTKLTALNHIEKGTPEIISFLDESKCIRSCCVSMIDFVSKKDVNLLRYNCFWCRHPVDTKPIGCPTKYISNQAVKKYHSHISKDTYTIKEGIMVKKAIEQHPDANKRKLIISNKASFTGAFIDEGKLSLTGNDKSYIIGDNLELILKLLSFKISDMISHFTKYRQDFLEKEVYTYLPDIRKLGIADITEDEFYKLIGLTNQEINQIKNPSSNEVVEEDEVENEVIEIEVKPKVKKLRIVKPKKKLLIIEEEETA